jgi:hypothetical protein
LIVAKKTKKEKELARLRREVEVLRAQLSEQDTTEVTKEVKVIRESGAKPQTLQQAGIQRVDSKFIKADLLRATILTLISLAVITILYIFRNRIPFF